MVYLSGQFGVTLMNFGTIQIAAYVGIFSAILLSLFIYATASATGQYIPRMEECLKFNIGHDRWTPQPGHYFHDLPHGSYSA